MCEWLKECVELKVLVKPGIVTGRGNKEHGGMTVLRQQDLIQHFDGGILNLLVSTSALEEGLDVPACNLVVRYNYVTNEIARLQAQGRARAKGSRCYAILEESSPKVYQEQLNKEREDLMIKALEYLPEGERLKKEIVKLQKEILSARDLQQKAQNESKICWGGDLRLLGNSHRVAITEDIYERCYLKKHDRSRETGDFVIAQKVHCKRCDQDVGVTIKWPEKGVEFPAIKCKQVMFCTPWPLGKIPVTKWSNAPFTVKEYNSLGAAD